ncbi:MAG: 5-methylthioadenosine phosphorylase [Actinomycetota bacterium]|nr:5-methylthioadenosine phosphorylase [Actinomycetota bacterium]
MSTSDTRQSVTEGSVHAEIGVIGGSGFYSWFDDADDIQIDTPFGSPSDRVLVGQVAGRSVAFLPRHGGDHRFPPHLVNYRANLWALRSLGVRQVLAPCAVGSMHPELGPGSLVVPDQLIDRTWGRAHTVYDAVGPVAHVTFADPYCPRARHTVLRAADAAGWPPRDGGTMVVINGPRFSTRAESRWHAALGGDVVGMTGMPEASIARELAMCYTSIAVVTDLDAGFESGKGVTQAEVFAEFGRSIEALKQVLLSVVADLPSDDDCLCQHSLDGLTLPFDLPSDRRSTLP